MVWAHWISISMMTYLAGMVNFCLVTSTRANRILLVMLYKTKSVELRYVGLIIVYFFFQDRPEGVPQRSTKPYIVSYSLFASPVTPANQFTLAESIDYRYFNLSGGFYK